MEAVFDNAVTAIIEQKNRMLESLALNDSGVLLREANKQFHAQAFSFLVHQHRSLIASDEKLHGLYMSKLSKLEEEQKEYAEANADPSAGLYCELISHMERIKTDLGETKKRIANREKELLRLQKINLEVLKVVEGEKADLAEPPGKRRRIWSRRFSCRAAEENRAFPPSLA